MKILFLTPYAQGESPSQRFRFEQYINGLSEKGHQYTQQSFLSAHDSRLFFSTGNRLKKIFALTTGFLKRIYILTLLPTFEVVFIHREATPVGPPVIEWIIRFIFRKRIVFDFDDAIWTTDRVDENLLIRILKWRSKVSAICRWSYKVSAGNEYLAAYARQFNSNVVINPTTIDTLHRHNPSLFSQKKDQGKINIGWTGSHSTLVYLNKIEKILQRIESENGEVNFIVIANQKPTLNLRSLVFMPWKEETEILDLLTLDIGIMPLPDDTWAKGKCGFKALQYMALKIPCVISPVGVNSIIVEHGVSGFLANSEDDWYHYITHLIADHKLRETIGEAGRQRITSYYSVIANTSNFLGLLESSASTMADK